MIISMVKRIMFVCPGGGPIVKRGESKTKLNFKLSSTFHSHNDDDDDDDKASRMAWLVFMHGLERSLISLDTKEKILWIFFVLMSKVKMSISQQIR